MLRDYQVELPCPLSLGCSCEGSWKGGVLTGEKRQNPHVQSYVVAMDQASLELVQEDPTVLRCYSRYHDAVWWVGWGGG